MYDLIGDPDKILITFSSHKDELAWLVYKDGIIDRVHYESIRSKRYLLKSLKVFKSDSVITDLLNYIIMNISYSALLENAISI